MADAAKFQKTNELLDSAKEKLNRLVGLDLPSDLRNKLRGVEKTLKVAAHKVDAISMAKADLHAFDRAADRLLKTAELMNDQLDEIIEKLNLKNGKAE